MSAAIVTATAEMVVAAPSPHAMHRCCECAEDGVPIVSAPCVHYTGVGYIGLCEDCYEESVELRLEEDGRGSIPLDFLLFDPSISIAIHRIAGVLDHILNTFPQSRYSGYRISQCTDVSALLAAVLVNVGLPADVMYGWHEDNTEGFHYWVRVGLVNIDLSARQFSYLTEARVFLVDDSYRDAEANIDCLYVEGVDMRPWLAVNRALVDAMTGALRGLEGEIGVRLADLPWEGTG